MSGRYEPHADYISCELPSWDEMPSHWRIGRIKYMTEMNPSKSEVRHLKADTSVTFLPMESIGDDGSLDVSKERPLHSVLNGYTYLAEGDVCVAKITPCFENGKGAIVSGLRNGIGFATTEVIPMRCNRDTDSQFLYYFLTCAPFNLDAEALMYGAGGQKRVADSFVANYSAAFPPPDEQKQIASFLDYETAKIDALIEKQQQLIALLGEKRQAVISHAVTKGLNPDAPMRDSGVEWLGEVPSHWDVERIGVLYSDSNRRAETNEEQELPILCVSIHHGISDRELTEEEMDRKVVRSDDRSLYKTVAANDLAYNMMRAWQGGFGASTVGGLISPAYVVAKPRTELESKYFELVLRTPSAIVELKRFSRGITDFRLRLYWENFKNIRVPVPDQSECKEIIEHVTAIGNRYDELADAAGYQIELLRERRTALISAAVTGKIDVRGWKRPSAAPKKETEMEVA